MWQLLALLLLGIAGGTLAPGRFEGLVRPATLYIFLPPLLFEAAWNLDGRAIARFWRPIAVMAGPGVVLSAAVVAGALMLLRVPLASAALAGAILSATDPIAVVAVFRRLRVPKTLVTLVECEALFNDGVAVLLYQAVLAAVLVGAQPGVLANVALATVVRAGAGVGIGLAIAWVVAWLSRNRASVLLQTLATALGAYGAYFAADRLGFSGIAATIACALALRSLERRWITLTIAREVARTWDLAAIAANAAVFFLVGAALQIGSSVREPVFALVCVAAVVVARYLVAALLAPMRLRPSWYAVVRVAGMRGALSLALALALPAAIPFRQAIVDATFAVALVTIALGAVFAGPTVRRAAMRRPHRRMTSARLSS